MSHDNSEIHSLPDTNFQFPNQQSVYHGKVRDVYDLNDTLIVAVTDRISAFDHILPRAIPFKGQVLNGVAAHFLEATRDICPNWLIAVPDPNISVGVKCDPIRLEMVVRGYLAGHSWREYSSGKRILCGVQMPEGMKESDKFPNPIITPATKAEEGHDEDISREQILERTIVTEEIYTQLEEYSLALFKRGTEMAEEQGLILVDTKYEFGMHNGEVYLIDEIHTPDSSRYYILDGYNDRQANDEKQQQLSKEFVREWLMSHGFQGKDGQLMPLMPDSFVELVSQRYIKLYERVTGKAFDKGIGGSITDRIEKNVLAYLSSASG